MSLKLTPIAQALSLALLLPSLPAVAQAQTPPSAATGAETITVTGVRASIEKSLTLKREATANVDVITAIDVGKMPDKNLADSLQRVVGVAVRTDYDEAEKVAMRGTNPDMSLILFNGHTVSGGDWFVADQASSSRSTSLSLMPSSVLNSATVYKTSQANVLDGGLAGTINITTRKPLSEKQSFGGVVSLGAVHADLPGKTSPLINASLNWKNNDSTFGVIGQVFAEKRYVRRDSASRFGASINSGWDVINTSTMLGITDASLAGTGFKAADLNGVRMPASMSAEYVEGVRDRQGGMFAAQLRLSNDLEVGFTGFYSKMKAENYGRLYSGAMLSMLQGLNAAGAVNGTTPSTRVYAQLRNPVIGEQITVNGDKLRYLQSGEIVYPNGSRPLYIGNMGTNLRSGAEASSAFYDFDGTWNVNKELTVKGLFSTTRGVGATALDQGMVYARNGLGTKFQLNGLQEAPTWSYTGAGGNTPTSNADGSGYTVLSRAGARNQTKDSESSLALDAEWDQGDGLLQNLQFGGRFAAHKRDLRRQVAALKTAAVVGPDASKAVPFPSNFGGGLGGGIDPGGFYFPRDVVVDYLAEQIRPTSEEFERRVATEIELKENQSAIYAMQSFDASAWTGGEKGWGQLTGNFGLRVVRTEVQAQIATPLNSTVCPKIEPGQPVVPCARYPGAINTASDGTNYYEGVPFAATSGLTYYKVPTKRSFDHLLPSLNLRWALNSELIARFGASQTIGRQNYNIYGAGYGAPSTNCASQNVCTVTGPNPTLEPQTAVNSDVSLAWFFARRSLVQISLFDSLIRGYPKTGPIQEGVTVDLADPTDANNTVRTYNVLTASQQKARIQGVELGWEQPIAFGFGINANLSYAKTRVADGRPMAGASKQSRNLGLYFENDSFSVRAVYNYRSEYVASSTAVAPATNSQGTVVIAGITMPTAYTWAAPVANVALSANWNVTPELQISFNGTNLTNPRRAQYLYSEAEVQKLDVSGRQYFLEARYKF